MHADYVELKKNKLCSLFLTLRSTTAARTVQKLFFTRRTSDAFANILLQTTVNADVAYSGILLPLHIRYIHFVNVQHNSVNRRLIYVSMQHNHVDLQDIACQYNYTGADINIWHDSINILHDDKIYHACRGKKCATIVAIIILNDISLKVYMQFIW